MTSAADLCRMVDLEWDRGHESLIAIVRAESTTGLVVSEVPTLSAEPGLRWIRAAEVVSIEDLEPSDRTVRLADRRGDRIERVDPALTELPALFARVQATASLVAIFTMRTGSQEALVGSVKTIAQDRLTLDEVDPDGCATGDVLSYRLNEIIGVDWDTTYLHDLHDLLTIES